MNGVPSFAVSAGSAWNALQASGQYPSIWMPETGGAVWSEYFEFKVPDPGGGKPMPVRLCGSVNGLLVVVRSATWWQSIHSAPSNCFHWERSDGQANARRSARVMRPRYASRVTPAAAQSPLHADDQTQEDEDLPVVPQGHAGALADLDAFGI